MKILSIDPGYDRVGIAILEKKNSKETLLYSDCFLTSKELSYDERLGMIGEEIERLIKKFKPTACAIEKLFFNKNQKTAMKVAQAKGAIMQIAISKNLPIYEYNTTQIKCAVTGYGKSTKDQVMSMVPKLIDISKDIKYDDEFDAIAVGLTCLAIEK